MPRPAIQERDFAALRARQELLIRFPVGDQDSGLLSAIPRERPPAAPPTPALRARLIAEARATPFRAARAPATNQQEHDDDAMLAALRHDAGIRGPSVVAEEFAGELAACPAEASRLIERLRARSAAHQQSQAAALLADGRQLPDAALMLRELSALRYGVDPLICACMVHLLAQRYPADPPTPRRGQGQRTVRTSDAAAQAASASADTSANAAQSDDGAWEGNPQPLPWGS